MQDWVQQSIWLSSPSRLHSLKGSILSQGLLSQGSSPRAPHSQGLHLTNAVTSQGPLLKALSNEFEGRLTIAEVHSSEEELVEVYAVDAFPQLHVVAPPRPSAVEGEVTQGAIVQFEGDFKDRAALLEFLEAHAHTPVPPAADDGGDDTGATDGATAATADDWLTADEFKISVLASRDAWIVALVRPVAPAEGATGADAWTKKLSLPDDWAATSAKAEGALRAGAVSCAEPEHSTEGSGLCAKYPKATWLVYGHGADAKRTPVKAKSGADALEAAGTTVPADKIIRLSPPMLDAFMSQAADEERVAIIIFSKKPEPSLLLKSLSLTYDESVLVGLLADADEETLARFQVDGRERTRSAREDIYRRERAPNTRAGARAGGGWGGLLRSLSSIFELPSVDRQPRS